MCQTRIKHVSGTTLLYTMNPKHNNTSHKHTTIVYGLYNCTCALQLLRCQANIGKWVYVVLSTESPAHKCQDQSLWNLSSYKPESASKRNRHQGIGVRTLRTGNLKEILGPAHFAFLSSTNGHLHLLSPDQEGVGKVSRDTQIHWLFHCEASHSWSLFFWQNASCNL